MLINQHNSPGGENMISRILFVTVLALLFAGFAAAQTCRSSMSKAAHDTGSAHSWKMFGSKIELKEVKPLGEVLEAVKEFEDEELLVCGQVTEVCQGKGCSMVVECGDKHIRVEFKDHGFFVPWDSKGKKVRMQGTISTKKITKALPEHMAAEMERPPVRKEKVKGEQGIMVFIASGVAMEGGSEIGEEQRAVIEGKKEHESGEQKH